MKSKQSLKSNNVYWYEEGTPFEKETLKEGWYFYDELEQVNGPFNDEDKALDALAALGLWAPSQYSIDKDKVNLFLEKIEINKNRLDGVPCIKNTRMPIAMILAEIAEGQTIEQIATNKDIDINLLKDVIEKIACYFDRSFVGVFHMRPATIEESLEECRKWKLTDEELKELEQ